MKVLLAIFVMILSSVSSVCLADDNLELTCHVNIPKEFKQDPPGWYPPNGESEAVRYTKSYEAFWWNCVLVKSSDLNGR